MGVSGLNKILDSKATGLAIFGVTGVTKLASDYKNASDEQKDFVLLRDSLILGGSALGVGLYGFVSGKISNNKTIKNKIMSSSCKLLMSIKNNNLYQTKLQNTAKKIKTPVKFVGEHLKNVVSNCVNNTMMLACGILGAVSADYGIRYSHLEKSRKLNKLSNFGDHTFNSLYNYEYRLRDNFQQSRFNKDMEQYVGAEIKSNVYSRITDLPVMKMFSRTMVGMQGFEVIEEKTFRKRMKHATNCLISNSVIPLFFLSLSSSLTKKMPGVLRAPLIFASLVGGTMYTNKLITKHEKKN